MHCRVGLLKRDRVGCTVFVKSVVMFAAWFLLKRDRVGCTVFVKSVVMFAAWFLLKCGRVPLFSPTAVEHVALSAVSGSSVSLVPLLPPNCC